MFGLFFFDLKFTRFKTSAGRAEMDLSERRKVLDSEVQGSVKVVQV